MTALTPANHTTPNLKAGKMACLEWAPLEKGNRREPHQVHEPGEQNLAFLLGQNVLTPGRPGVMGRIMPGSRAHRARPSQDDMEGATLGSSDADFDEAGVYF